MTQMTEQEAFRRLAALCARAEHCRHEMDERMRRWGMEADERERVVLRLEQERYVDDERYARAFARDKVRYNKWGRRKVEQALWLKRIDDDVVRQALDAIGEEEYCAVLKPLLDQKRRSTSAASAADVNRKLIRFALGRGFTFDIIRQCIDADDADFDAE